MARYGASVDRVPARSGGNITDTDVYKLGIMFLAERGLSGVHKEIYGTDDFYKKCGGHVPTKLGAYVVDAFFRTLKQSLNVELLVLPFVALDAVQAAGQIMDSAGTPVKIFDIKAGRKGKPDKSAFGNKIAFQITRSNDLTFRLAGDAAAGAITASLTSVDGLEVGYYVQFTNGTNTEVKVITSIDKLTRNIGFSALANAYASSNTTVSRLDWSLYIGVKDDLGNIQPKESTRWENVPMSLSNLLGMPALVNDPISGSDFAVVEVNSANASPPDRQIPASVSNWTFMFGGSDGSAPTDNDWKNLVAQMQDYNPMIMLAPESASVAHNRNMTDFATAGYKWMYYTQAPDGADEDVLKNFGASIRGPVMFGMLPADKWFEVDDPSRIGKKIHIPSVGHAAAHWFNTYSMYGESKVAAGNKDEMILNTSDRLLDGNGIIHDDRKGQGKRLIEDYSVNIARYRIGIGVTINSARTFSTTDGYNYQNQIMQWIIYARSILTFLRLAEQDQSGAGAQASHRALVYAYMLTKFEQGHLYSGYKPDGTKVSFEDVCVIINDFTNNTLAMINKGEEVTFLQFIAPPPIEKPRLDLASAPVTMIRM